MRFPRIAILVACLILIGSLAEDLHAKKTRGIGVVPVRTAQGKQVDLYRGSHALLIGVSDYTAGWPDLESIPGELKSLRKVLLRKGFNVVSVLNPDSRKLKRAFESFVQKYGYDPQNRLLFYYSGHGYTRKVGRRQKGYLVPTDAPDPNRDDRGFARKSLSMGLINTWAREIEAKHALFLFDSCFSGTIFKTRALPTPRHITDKTTRPVRQFITAGSAGEEVPARSVFLPSFIRAIEGEGDVDKDGYVTGTELGQYLHKTVLAYNTGQTPQFGKIKDPELDEGDFVFRAPKAKQAKPRVAAAKPSRSSPRAAAPVSIDAEEEFWRDVKETNTALDYEEYLQAYPRGRFAGIAKRRIRRLKRAVSMQSPRSTAIAPTPPPAVAKLERRKPPPVPAAPAGGALKRLAVFSGVIVDPEDQFSVAAVTGRLERAITRKYGGGLEVVRGPGAAGNSFVDVGAFSTDVKEGALLVAARKAGIDLAVAFGVRLVPGNYGNYSGTDYTVFLVDVKSGRINREAGSVGSYGTLDGSWIEDLTAEVITLIETYAREARINLKAAAPPPAVAKLERLKPAAPRPLPLRAGKGAKLAIFPEVLVGDSPEAANIESPKLAARISRQIAKHPGSVYVAYSYLELPKKERAGLRSSVWKIGYAITEPNVEGVLRKGRALGVDVVIQVLIRSTEWSRGGSFSFNHEVHILSVNSGNHFRISGFSRHRYGWELLNDLEHSIGEALEKYKRAALQQ